MDMIRDLQITEYKEGNPNYHNTKLLLKMFRAIAFEVSKMTTKLERFTEKEYGAETGTFFALLEEKGVSIINEDYKFQKNLSKLKYYQEVLTYLEGHITILKNSHPNGDVLYTVLYYTYIIPHKPGNQKIRELISDDIGRESVISERTYLRYLDIAISELDKLLWDELEYGAENVKTFLILNADKLLQEFESRTIKIQ